MFAPIYLDTSSMTALIVLTVTGQSPTESDSA